MRDGGKGKSMKQITTEDFFLRERESVYPFLFLRFAAFWKYSHHFFLRRARIEIDDAEYLSGVCVWLPVACEGGFFAYLYASFSRRTVTQ